MATVDTVQNRINLANWRLVGVALIVLTSALIGVYLGFHSSVSPDVIFNGVQVSGIPVGGIKATEAQKLLDEKLRTKIERPIYLRWDGGDEFVYPADIGISADTAMLINKALRVGREGNILQQIRDRYRIRSKGYNIPLQAKGGKKLDSFLRSFKQRVDSPPVNASVRLDAHNMVSIVPGKVGSVVNTEKLRHNLLVAATQVDRDITASVQVKEPEITASELRSWDITEIVARFDTTFKTTDANRTHNLRVAAQALNGALIAPGATFSFNQQVGPRASNTGYKEAPAVVDGELVPDIGGGVCQVSSTLFNAVLLAGLRIDSRQSHSIPSTYVPLGQDATVAYNYIDFKFTNTTKNYIYVKAWIEGNKVRVTLLGANPAPLSRIVSKVEEVVPAPVQETRDSSLPVGKRVVERVGGKGYKVSVWRVTGPQGSENWQMIGRSTYKPRAQVLRVGTAAHRSASPSQSASAMVVSHRPQG